jgi:hypothetical protein
MAWMAADFASAMNKIPSGPKEMLPAERIAGLPFSMPVVQVDADRLKIDKPMTRLNEKRVVLRFFIVFISMTWPHGFWLRSSDNKKADRGRIFLSALEMM